MKVWIEVSFHIDIEYQTYFLVFSASGVLSFGLPLSFPSFLDWFLFVAKEPVSSAERFSHLGINSHENQTAHDTPFLNRPSEHFLGDEYTNFCILFGNRFFLNQATAGFYKARPVKIFGYVYGS